MGPAHKLSKTLISILCSSTVLAGILWKSEMAFICRTRYLISVLREEIKRKT